MTKPAQRFLSLVLLLLTSTLANAHHLIVRAAWIPEAPPVTTVMAGFMNIENKSAAAEEIVSVSSPDFDRIEMHLSKEENGIARMIPQKKLVIPAKSTLTLEHGSYHLMLFKPKRRLLDGDSTELMFKLADGNSFTIKFKIEKSAMNMDHSNHH